MTEEEFRTGIFPPAVPTGHATGYADKYFKALLEIQEIQDDPMLRTKLGIILRKALTP